MQLFYCGKQWGYSPRLTNNSPVNFCLPPTGLSTTIKGQFILFSWVAPHPYVTFTLEYRIGISGPYTIVQVDGTSIMLSLLENTTYQWRVKTNCSVLSSIYVSGTGFTTGALIAGCIAVSPNTINFIDLGNDEIKVTWDATGAISYRVELTCPKDYISEIETTTTSAIFSLEFFSSCQLFIYAKCKDGTIKETGPVTVSLPSKDCNPPIKLNGIVSKDSIFISWFSDNLGNDLFNIYINDTIVAENYNLTNFVFTGLTSNTVYNIKVIAVCKTGFSIPAVIDIATIKSACDVSISTLVYDPVTFILTWTAAIVNGIVSQYKIIINNGVPVYVNDNVFTYAVPAIKRNIGFSATVIPICIEGNEGVSKTIIYTNDTCIPPVIISTIQTDAGVTLLWAPVLNVLSYQLTYFNDVDTSPIVIDNISTSSYTLLNLIPGRTYTFSLKSVCVFLDLVLTLSSATVTTLLIAPPTVINYFVPLLRTLNNNTIEVTVAKNPLFIYFPTGRLIVKNNLNAVIIDTVIENNTVFTIQSNLILPTAGSISVIAFSVNPLDLGLVPAGVNVYNFNIGGCVIANPPAFSFINANSISVVFNHTQNASITKMFIKYALQGEEYNEGILFNTTVSNFVLPISNLGKYKFLYKFLCNGKYTEEVEFKYLCPALTGLKVSSFGSGIKGIIEPALIGDFTYRITLQGLNRAELTYSTKTNEFTIFNLWPGFIYAGKVELVCNDTLPQTFSNSIQFVVQTQIVQIEDCSEPMFNVIKQDSLLPVVPNCVAASLPPGVVLPNFTFNVPYLFDILLTGTPPFTIVRMPECSNFVNLVIVNTRTLRISGLAPNQVDPLVNVSFKIRNCANVSVSLQEIVTLNL